MTKYSLLDAEAVRILVFRAFTRSVDILARVYLFWACAGDLSPDDSSRPSLNVDILAHGLPIPGM